MNAGCPNHQPELQRDGSYWCPHCPQPYEQALNRATTYVSETLDAAGALTLIFLAFIIVCGTIGHFLGHDDEEIAMLTGAIWFVVRIIKGAIRGA